MIETELGTLRRSHYSDEITSSMDGQDVTIMGWVVDYSRTWKHRVLQQFETKMVISNCCKKRRLS